MAVKKWRGKWVADFTTPDGKRMRRASPVQTRAGAEQFEAELRVASSTLTPCSESRPVGFREFAVEWLKTYAVVNNKPSEVVSKEGSLRVHLVPFFDSKQLNEIGALDIERYKALKVGQKLSKKTINNHLACLRKLLVTAQEWGYLEHVPRIRRLPVGPSTFDWLTFEETIRFLKAIEAHYPQWKALFVTALRTGMRRGEIFALQWDDVDLKARTILVRHSVYRGKLGTPKNGRTRSIPMTSGLQQVLSEHRAATMLKSEFVFPASDGKLTIHQDHVDRALHGALKRAGLRRIRFHDLRHTFASQLVSAGRSLKEVQELLGHQGITMTMRYAHLAPERMRQAVEVLEQGSSRPSSSPDLEQDWNK